MKKRIAILLTGLMSISLLSGCGQSEKASNKLYIGLGGLSGYSNFDERQNTGGSVEVIGSVVLFDENGKILDINTDSYEIRKAFVEKEDGTIKLKEKGVDQTIGAFPHIRKDNPDSLLTKYGVGDNYGIDNLEGNLGKDWFLQMRQVEDAMIGKTVDEVVNSGFAGRDDKTKSPLYPLANINAASDSDVISGASIYLDTHVRTLIEAWNNKVEVQGYTAKDADKLKIGLGMTGELKADEKLYTSVFAGSLFDGDKVVYTKLDAVDIPYITKKYDGYSLVMVDSNKYQTRKTSFNGIDAGWIETMRDLNKEKDGKFYSVYKAPTGEGMQLTDNKYLGKVLITEDEVFMEDENSPLKKFAEFEKSITGKTLKDIAEDSIMKEAVQYSKDGADDSER
ncbi:hypothetical protein [Clostridium polynesiense]|uniref:hypothetical protein n=1 Tax=Clostridium polynesiense TaxID=1325933 RepID=UPI00058E4F94|nr:hypothetical protein [Clostridium polynesiense]